MSTLLYRTCTQQFACSVCISHLFSVFITHLRLGYWRAQFNNSPRTWTIYFCQSNIAILRVYAREQFTSRIHRLWCLFISTSRPNSSRIICRWFFVRHSAFYTIFLLVPNTYWENLFSFIFPSWHFFFTPFAHSFISGTACSWGISGILWLGCTSHSALQRRSAFRNWMDCWSYPRRVFMLVLASKFYLFFFLENCPLSTRNIIFFPL